MKFILFSLGMLSTCLLNAQNSAQNNFIKLNKTGYEKSAFQSMGHVPFFELHKNEMFEPVDLTGADIYKVKIGVNPIKLPSFPEQYTGKAISYGYLYRNLLINSTKREFLAILIPDYRFQRTTNKLDVWIDFNGDWDFSNDPRPNLKQIAQEKWFVQLDSFGGGYDLQWFPVPQFRKFAQMNDTAMKDLIGPRDYLGSNYSLKANRKAVLYTSINDSDEIVHVGILDRNFNGSFKDPEDLIMLSEGDSIFNADNSIELLKNQRITWKGKDYRTTVIQTNQEYSIEFKELTNSKHRISIGKKIPKAKVFVSPKSTKKVDINQKLRRRRLTKILNKKAEIKLVYFWSAINTDFEKDSAQLHAILRENQKNPKFDAVMINFGGSLRYISGYNSRYSINPKQLIADSKLIAKLNIQKMPQFLILDRKNRILYIGSNLQTIEDYTNRTQ